MNKQNLEKLINFVCEIAELDGNQWMREKLEEKFSQKLDTSIGLPQMDEIYEYCLRKIVKEHAEKFYEEFKLTSIKDKLIDDFIRMEKFRREDKFEDFCMAVYQQVEGIVNALSSKLVKQYIIDNKDVVIYKEWNKELVMYEEKKLLQLIFYFKLTEDDVVRKFEKEMLDWDFNDKFKSILFYYYFNKRYISSFAEFQKIAFLGFDLHQARNLNHRGGKITENQQKTILKVQSNSHKYYFKFIGFLEDFITRINYRIEPDKNL
jgi:hypothetical protein